MNLLDRRLVFVTGKGGVGKTSVAAGLALLAAGEGKRTLLCEVDAKGDIAAAFESGPLAFEPTEVVDDLHAMVMSTEESLKEYLRIHLRLPLVTRIGPLARSFDFVASAAPGVREVLTIGKLAYEVREDHYDIVIVDASATGHVVGQLASPAAIHDLVRVGLVREQTDWMLEILRDPAVTGTAIVAVPEEMPVTETLELSERLGTETEVDLAAVIVNRVLPELFGQREEAAYEELIAVHADDLAVAAGPSVKHVLSGAALAVQLRRTRAAHIARLRDGLPAGVPMPIVPELFTRDTGIRATRMMAQALGDELL
ncbi:MAG: ArsA-related P-loop ATPase [Actinomycetota bacterium]